MSEERYIGKRVSAIDSPIKATGTADYVADLRLPGMAYGKVLRSPHAHARIRSLRRVPRRKAAGRSGRRLPREHAPGQVGHLYQGRAGVLP